MEFWQGFARRVAEFCYRIWPSSSPRSAILESVAFWGPGVGGGPREPGKSISYMKLLSLGLLVRDRLRNGVLAETEPGMEFWQGLPARGVSFAIETGGLLGRLLGPSWGLLGPWAEGLRADGLMG